MITEGLPTVVVPEAIPEDVPMVTAPVLEVHVPPGVVGSVKLIVLPWHTVDGPAGDIGPGSGLTVNCRHAMQPVLVKVKQILVVLAGAGGEDTAVIVPSVGGVLVTAATPVLLLVHIPAPPLATIEIGGEAIHINAGDGKVEKIGDPLMVIS